MEKSKTKLDPQWKKQRRWSLLWLAVCSLIVLMTVLRFEAIAESLTLVDYSRKDNREACDPFVC